MRCDVIYDGQDQPGLLRLGLSRTAHPPASAWAPSTGDVNLKDATAALRRASGLAQCETCARRARRSRSSRCASGTMRATSFWRAMPPGVVAPSSGEGIYYAMTGGRCAADAARRRWPRVGKDQRSRGWRASSSCANTRPSSTCCRDAGRLLPLRPRRERFVSLCHDIDVQKLTFEAYMNKKLVKARPMAHMKIGFKNLRT